MIICEKKKTFLCLTFHAGCSVKTYKLYRARILVRNTYKLSKDYLYDASFSRKKCKESVTSHPVCWKLEHEHPYYDIIFNWLDAQKNTSAQWNTLPCVVRCLIKLRSIETQRISMSTFISGWWISMLKLKMI